jgi:hypothetical protein
MRKLVSAAVVAVQSFAVRSITILSAMTRGIYSESNSPLRPVRVYARITPLGLRVLRNKGSPGHPRR